MGNKIKIAPEKLICSYREGSEVEIEDGHSSIPLRDPDDELRIAHMPTFTDTCKYCRTRLSQANFGSKDKGIITVLEKSIDLYYCKRCGWWFLVRSEGQKHYTGRHFIINTIEGNAKYYEVDSYNVPIVELRNFLKYHPHNLAHVNPYRFELLMKDCFEDFFGHCEVLHVGGSGDGGIDLKIILNKKDTILVQVKRRFDITKNEGPQVVRELNGVLFRENIPKGIVVTTSKGFTDKAYFETRVKTPTKKKYEMKLMAFNDIIGMLNLPRLRPYKPWEKYLGKFDLKKDMLEY